jgi:hypothetical protein
MTSSSTAPTAQDEGRSGRRLATLLGAAALVMILVILALLITVGRRDGNPPAAAPAPAPPAANPVDGATGAATLTTAPVARWELYQGAALPYSPDYGPRTVQGLGPATGYSHNPAGALFAAAQLSARALLAPNGDWEKIVMTQVLPGPGRDAGLAAGANRNVAPNTPPSPALTQFAGFRIANYTDSAATVDLVTRAKTGQLQTSTSTVDWVDGDWKLVFTPAGSVSTYPLAVPSLAGYIPWSGV